MIISKKLIDLSIISGEKTVLVFYELYQDILEIKKDLGSHFITEMWARWNSYQEKSNSLSGAVFEVTLATLLYRLGILPLYAQSNLCTRVIDNFGLNS